MLDTTSSKVLNNEVSEVIEIVRKNAGYIPIFLAFSGSLSKEGKLGDLTQKYALTEITSEIGPSGERVFELLTKRILECFEKENKEKIKIKKYYI